MCIDIYLLFFYLLQPVNDSSDGEEEEESSSSSKEGGDATAKQPHPADKVRVVINLFVTINLNINKCK